MVLQGRTSGRVQLDGVAGNLSQRPRTHPAVDGLADGGPQQVLVQGQRLRRAERGKV